MSRIMSKLKIIKVVISILIVVAVAVGINNIVNTNKELDLNLQESSTKLEELNSKHIKINQELEKSKKTNELTQEQKNKLEEEKKILEQQKTELEQQLQAKREAKQKVASMSITSGKSTSATSVKTQTASITGDKNTWLSQSGIPQSEWTYVDYIVNRESSWNPNAVNASSGACGLMQFLPCSPQKAGADWNNPVSALQRGNNYAVSRYGSWQGAYNFWVSNHWW